MTFAGQKLQAGKIAHDRWNQSSGYDRFVFASALVCLIAVSVLLVWHGNFPTPDQLFLIALAAAIIVGRLRVFLWDWIPLMVLLFGYEYVRGLVPLLSAQPHSLLMIRFDQWLFGAVPSVSLQARYCHPGDPRWYDFASVILYLSHFVLPLTIAFALWIRDRATFRQYAAGMVILSYLAYFTYLAYPAVPPWLAVEIGVLGDVHRTLMSTAASLPGRLSIPSFHALFGVNTVAAVPSLHAAYPLLSTVFMARVSRYWIAPMALYTLGVWVAVVYLGEHYVFDVIAGALYALATLAILKFLPRWLKKPAGKDQAGVS